MLSLGAVRYALENKGLLAATTNAKLLLKKPALTGMLLPHRVAQQTMWQSFRSADNKARAEVLHVLPHPSDWDEAQHVTGYWFLEPPPGWEPPADLLSFLQAGPPPIYIGFGSMSSRKPAEASERR